MGDKRILSETDISRSQREEQPAALSELALINGDPQDQNDHDANPCGLCTFVASFRRHIVRIQRERERGYYFVREYFQLTKDEKCAASLGNSR